MTWNLPNVLTFLRIAAVPLLVVAILVPFRGQDLAAFLIFLLATLTDTLDGYWARRRQQVTELGQILDPIADKLLVVSALISLVGTGRVKAWMAVVIVGRELVVTGFRAVAALKGLAIPASLLGKLKMMTETVTILLLLLGPQILGGFYWIASLSLWLAMALAVASAAEYLIRFAPRLVSTRPGQT